MKWPIPASSELGDRQNSESKWKYFKRVCTILSLSFGTWSIVVATSFMRGIVKGLIWRPSWKSQKKINNSTSKPILAHTEPTRPAIPILLQLQARGLLLEQWELALLVFSTFCGQASRPNRFHRQLWHNSHACRIGVHYHLDLHGLELLPRLLQRWYYLTLC